MTEVAHDYQPQVKKFISEELGLVNSFDTWHGTSSCMIVAFYFTKHTLVHRH